jgi:DNA-binding transcriptional LysR family regulator
MIDWQDLHHFLVVARTGSLTAASRELSVDHATVGRRIARLEAATGLKLIDRLPRSSRLTLQGADLAAAAAAFGDGAEAVLRHLRHAPDPLSGTVTISALPLLAAHVIAPSLAALRERHPALTIALTATSAVATLDRGDVDITIGYVRSEVDARIVRRLGEIRLGLYASTAHAARAPADWAFIMFEKALDHIPQQRWLARLGAGRRIALRTSDVATQIEAARTDVGVALLPSFLAERREGLVRVAAESMPPTLAVWMAVHVDMRRSPTVRAVMDHLATVTAATLR